MFEEMDHPMKDCFARNDKASTEFCRARIEMLYEPIQTELEACINRHSQVGAQAPSVADAEEQLLCYRNSINSVVEQYDKQAAGPSKTRVLAEFLGQKVNSLLRIKLTLTRLHSCWMGWFSGAL